MKDGPVSAGHSAHAASPTAFLATWIERVNNLTQALQPFTIAREPFEREQHDGLVGMFEDFIRRLAEIEEPRRDIEQSKARVLGILKRRVSGYAERSRSPSTAIELQKILHEQVLPLVRQVDSVRASHNGDHERANPIEPRVANYQIVRRLGEGGASVVYLARETAPGGIERAIKIMIPFPTDQADERQPPERFTREVNALRALKHRGIVSYIHSGFTEDGRHLFVVMDYVEGETLRAAARTMSFDDRVRALVEVLDALEHSHGKGIYHRDVKPSNIVVRISDRQPVLVDFGLAFRDDDETHTHTGAYIGTPGYISPEALQDPRQSRTPMHDVFAAGVMLYELIAGRLARLPYVPVGDIEPALARLDPIILRAIARDVRARYQSAGEFGDELRRYLAASRSGMRAAGSTTPDRFSAAAEAHARAVAAQISLHGTRREAVEAAAPLLGLVYDRVRSEIDAVVAEARAAGLSVGAGVDVRMREEHGAQDALVALAAPETGSVWLYRVSAPLPRPPQGFEVLLQARYQALPGDLLPFVFQLSCGQLDGGLDRTEVVHDRDGTPRSFPQSETLPTDVFATRIATFLANPELWNPTIR